ncbi:MAG: methyltransferase domain-containing protein, partial [Actinomycetota bacterium]|nr:methyltransferase domain-containing protein [Actinomycetota bacterium]
MVTGSYSLTWACPDGPDLDAYAALAVELGARSVLDIGCGTGTFACLLARRGIAVTAVEPRCALDPAHQVRARLGPGDLRRRGGAGLRPVRP